MRREIVEAVRASVRPCMDEDACGNRGLTDEDAEAIARRVLRVALTGEDVVEAAALALYLDCEGITPGDWAREVNKEAWRKPAREALAAVANALNLSRDLAAGGNDGE